MSQPPFDFIGADLSVWYCRLNAAYGRLGPVRRRKPIGQLVKSLISSRTYDAVSLAAYKRLGARWGRVSALARATPKEIEAVIADVTFADAKAPQLAETLRRIEADHPDFRLDFLADRPLTEALAWLERLPGVGRKVAAATLNFSTLKLPVFVVDSHVHRVLQRLGLVGESAMPAATSELVTASTLDWSPDDHLEMFAHLKRLGQDVCRHDAPDCGRCPLAACCVTAKGMDASRTRH